MIFATGVLAGLCLARWFLFGQSIRDHAELTERLVRETNCDKEPAMAPKAGHELPVRHVRTQSQARYLWWRATPRFEALEERSHG
eukprot:10024762-Lingulodinium_polyedra.AAC.1